MTLEYKYLDGFMASCDSYSIFIDNEEILIVPDFHLRKNKRINRKSINKITLAKNNLVIHYHNSSYLYQLSTYIIINKIKTYYLYNRRKSIIENL